MANLPIQGKYADWNARHDCMPSSRKVSRHDVHPSRLRIKSIELISNQTLQASSAFDRDTVTLAQDLAYHHVTHIGLCAAGGQDMTAATPCLVLSETKADKNKTSVVSGLASFFISRTVGPNQSTWCHVLASAMNRESLVRLERRWLLSFAPNYCHSGPEGAALLKRIWQFSKPDERAELYGVTAFTDFAKRANLAIRRQAKAPFASTRAYYAPQDQLQFPEF